MNEDDFLEMLYANSYKTAHEYCPIELFDAYLEYCREDEQQQTLTEKDFQEAVDRAIFEYDNSCNCSCGCSYCL